MRSSCILPVSLAGVLLLAAGCSSRPGASRTEGLREDLARAHKVYESVVVSAQGEPLDASSLAHQPFDFQSKGPLEFLDFLASGQRGSAAADGGVMSYTVWGTHRGWIRASDLDALLALFDSTQPCRPVCKEISSFLGTEPSTIGREAAFLVEGFRRDVEGTGYGGYPPALNSDRPPPDIAEIRAWLERYRASR